MKQSSAGLTSSQNTPVVEPNTPNKKSPFLFIIVAMLLLIIFSEISYIIRQSSVKKLEEAGNVNQVKSTHVPTPVKSPQVAEYVQIEPTIAQKEYLLSNGKKIEINNQGFKNDIYLISENGASKKIYTFETQIVGGIVDFVESEGYFALTHIGSMEAEIVKLFSPEGEYIPLGESEVDMKNYQSDKERVIGTRGGLGDTEIKFANYKGEKTLEVVFRVVEGWAWNYDLTGKYIKGSFRIIN